MVAHCPNLGKSDQAIMEFIPDRQNWIKLLREFDNVFKHELGLALTSYREKKAIEVNPIISQSAARFCYMFHWSDLREEADDEPSTSKRARIATKVEYMLEKIKSSSTDFNWKWFIVFSELITSYSDSVNIEDVPEILKMLSECQPHIDYTKDNNSQIYAFTRCCLVLIKKEKDITNHHVLELCKKLWMKIGDEVVRVCGGNSKGANEIHALLQLLIQYGKCSAASFIESVLKIFTSATITRNDRSLKTLIGVLKFFNLDSLANGKELSKNILNFALQKHTMASLKKVIASGNEKPSNNVVSELATCCCLLKTDVINFVKKNQTFNDEKIFEDNWDLKVRAEYIKEIETTVRLMRKKNLTMLILEDEDFLKVNFFISVYD